MYPEKMKITFIIYFVLLINVVFSKPLGSTQEITTESSEEIEKKITACEQDCAITMDYQQKCGTDGKTYVNQSLVDCRDTCGKPYGRRVHTASQGPCPKKTS
ncbi:hypothetical protein HHI36_018729 [Cryptolaemus montrouzieri]|uniref:Kazal-like domain-containing protein n=1 Tax=Cryptolaemus montrouzieri TaxID=559131 RepID=A0ABD2P0S8_9CUCU